MKQQQMVGRCLAGVLGLMVTVAGAKAQPSDWDIRGEARNPDTGDLIYREYHQYDTTASDGYKRLTVRYFQPDGTDLATKTLTWDLGFDYLASLTWDDRVAGISHRGHWDAPDYVQRVDRPEGSSSRVARLDRPETVVLDAAFDQYLRDHIETLRNGDSLVFPFLSLGAERTYQFRARPNGQSDNQLSVTVEPANAVIRWLVDPIELTYSLAPVRLMTFTGVTNFRRDGDLIPAEIQYDYPD